MAKPSRTSLSKRAPISGHPRNAAEHKRICELFKVKAHRWEKMPSARELGITSAKRAIIIRIRRLYGEVLDELSYHTARECETKLAQAEALIATHWPQEWERLQVERAKRGEVIEMPSQEETTLLEDEVSEVFGELVAS